MREVATQTSDWDVTRNSADDAGNGSNAEYRRVQRPGQQWQEQSAQYAQRAQASQNLQAIASGSSTGQISGQSLAKFLGWFSIGLGFVELLSPESIARLVGVEDHEENRKTLRVFGAREIASGVGILTQSKPAGWLWSRVGGDALDFAFLARQRNDDRVQKDRLAQAMLAVAGIAGLDLVTSQKVSSAMSSNGDGLSAEQLRKEPHAGTVNRSITIDKTPEELYQFWHNFENLPSFMGHLKSVKTLDDKRSHWVAKAPMDASVEWDAEVIEDIPNRRIAWRSLEGADVDNTGSVEFLPATGGRGTVLNVKMEYRPPAGMIGATIAKIFGQAPEKQIPMDLHRLKQVLETGETARTEGQPAGRPTSTSPIFDDFLRK